MSTTPLPIDSCPFCGGVIIESTISLGTPPRSFPILLCTSCGEYLFYLNDIQSLESGPSST